jgi:AraC-like DNA-binding protein
MTMMLIHGSTPNSPLSTMEPVRSEKPMWMKMAETSEKPARMSRQARPQRFSRKSGRGRLCWLIIEVNVRRPNQKWQWPPWVILTPGDLAELTRKLRHGEESVWLGNPRMRSIFREVADCISHWDHPGAASRLTVSVNRLLVELLAVLSEQQLEESAELTTRRRTVELFLKDLAENPGSLTEPWTLETMALECGMGITTMAKYCRELVNSGPMAYLNLCRLEHGIGAK